MLKGHVFKFQTFANEAFAHFINTFLQGNMGITKGCNLSKTSNSVTISAGYFCVMGRFLEIVGNETISDISNTGYYQLICEIDLSQTNTSSELNQAVIKLIRNTSAYSNLTKEDLFNGGSLYQYEFARFKVTEQGIIDFVDRRTFLSITSLYSQINSNFNTLFNAKDEEADELLEEIRQELASVVDGSAYLLKSGGDMTGDLNLPNNEVNAQNFIGKINGYEWDIETENTVDTWLLVMNGDKIQHRAINTILPAMAIVTGTITMPEANSGYLTNTVDVSYPSGFNKDNCVIISVMSHNTSNTNWATPSKASATSTIVGNGETYAILMSDKIRVSSAKCDTAAPRKDVTFKLVLMKIA